MPPEFPILIDISAQLFSSEAKREYSVPRERLVIGAVGRLSAEKGFDLLIRSVAQLIAKGFDVEVWIAGEGDQEYRLQRLAEDLNLSDRVRLLGFQPDPIRLYQAMDVFALSSLREGLPNVLLEAMALEVPVVCTRVAGIPKLIDHEENGLLVDPGSIESLSDGLGKILTSSEMRARLASSARRTVENNHGFAPRMDRIKSIYDGMFVQGSSR